MKQFLNILVVGAGGFLGSVFRYLVSGALQKLSPEGVFPLGTLGVNVIGCLVIGLLAGAAENMQVFGPQVRLFLFLGVLGGFTTFSSFGYETMSMLRDGQALAAMANVGLHVVAGLFAVWLGLTVTAAV